MKLVLRKIAAITVVALALVVVLATDSLAWLLVARGSLLGALVILVAMLVTPEDA